MTAYIIVTRESAIRDDAEMAEYSRLNRENAEEFRNDYQLKPLVVYGASEGLEGAAPEGVIILQFPTVAGAKAWYNSPSYQAALPHRMKAADFRAILVEGL